MIERRKMVFTSTLLSRRYWMYIAIYRNLGNSSQCVQAMKSDAIITRYKDKYICTKCIFSVYRYIEKLNKGVDCILIYVNACFPLTQYGILQRKNKWMYSDNRTDQRRSSTYPVRVQYFAWNGIRLWYPKNC